MRAYVNSLVDFHMCKMIRIISLMFNEHLQTGCQELQIQDICMKPKRFITARYCSSTVQRSYVNSTSVRSVCISSDLIKDQVIGQWSTSCCVTGDEDIWGPSLSLMIHYHEHQALVQVEQNHFWNNQYDFTVIVLIYNHTSIIVHSLIFSERQLLKKTGRCQGFVSITTNGAGNT